MGSKEYQRAYYAKPENKARKAKLGHLNYLKNKEKRLARTKQQKDERQAQWYAFFASKGMDKCIVCGYNDCINVVVMHHLNPEKKTIAVSQWIRSHAFNEKNIRIMEVELQNCVSLCHNCHSELHQDFGIFKK